MVILHSTKMIGKMVSVIGERLVYKTSHSVLVSWTTDIDEDVFFLRATPCRTRTKAEQNLANSIPNISRIDLRSVRVLFRPYIDLSDLYSDTSETRWQRNHSSSPRELAKNASEIHRLNNAVSPQARPSRRMKWRNAAIDSTFPWTWESSNFNESYIITELLLHIPYR